MEVRRLVEKDLCVALQLVWEVFQEFEAPDYAEHGVAEFKKFIEYDAIIQKFKQGNMVLWGCFHDAGDLLGVIATRGGNHISLLFVRKAFHRQGIARKLTAAVIAECCATGQVLITVNSSPYALEAYHHLGFVATDTEQEVNGLRFIPMAYIIGNRKPGY